MSEQESNDGAGGPPWLGAIAKWFLAASLLLLLPRQWVPAAAALVTGIVLHRLAERRKNHESSARASPATQLGTRRSPR